MSFFQSLVLLYFLFVLSTPGNVLQLLPELPIRQNKVYKCQQTNKQTIPIRRAVLLCLHNALNRAAFFFLKSFLEITTYQQDRVALK